MSMSCLILCFLLVEEDSTLHYLKPSGTKYVSESEITRSKDGSRYHSVTHRGNVHMDLTATFDKNKHVQSAKIAYKTKAGTTTARATVTKRKVTVHQGDKESQSLPLKMPLVLATTAPDWSDIILLMQRYDHNKEGKQTFQGLWFHPTRPAHLRTFIVERLGSQLLEEKGKSSKIGRFRVTLRSGAYLVWANEDGLVYRLRGAGQKPERAIVLRGYEMITQGW